MGQTGKQSNIPPVENIHTAEELGLRVEDDFEDFEVYLEEDEIILDPKMVSMHGPDIHENLLATNVMRRISNSDYLGGRYLRNLEYAKRMDALGGPGRLIDERKKALEVHAESFRAELAAIASRSHLAEALEEKAAYLSDDLRVKLDVDAQDKPFIELLLTADNKTLLEFIEWNRDYIVAESEAMQPAIEKVKQRFIVRLETAIREQHLPLTLKQLHGRMQDIRIIVTDPVSMFLEDMGGYYDGSSRTIAIAATKSEVYLEAVLYHELLHHISGQTLIEYSAYDPQFEDYDDSPTIFCERSGLASTYMEHPSPRWMNEAITEQLTQLLLSEEGRQVDFKNIQRNQFFNTKKGTYVMARGALYYTLHFDRNDQLLRVMLRAYFEDMHPDINTQNSLTIKFWNMLSKQWSPEILDVVYGQDRIMSKEDFEVIKAKYARLRMLKSIFG